MFFFLKLLVLTKVSTTTETTFFQRALNGQISMMKPLRGEGLWSKHLDHLWSVVKHTGVGKCPNVSHHPTIEDTIFQHLWEGDVKQIPIFGGHLQLKWWFRWMFRKKRSNKQHHHKFWPIANWWIGEVRKLRVRFHHVSPIGLPEEARHLSGPTATLWGFGFHAPNTPATNIPAWLEHYGQIPEATAARMCKTNRF